MEYSSLYISNCLLISVQLPFIQALFSSPDSVNLRRAVPHGYAGHPQVQHKRGSSKNHAVASVWDTLLNINCMKQGNGWTPLKMTNLEIRTVAESKPQLEFVDSINSKMGSMVRYILLVRWIWGLPRNFSSFRGILERILERTHENTPTGWSITYNVRQMILDLQLRDVNDETSYRHTLNCFNCSNATDQVCGRLPLVSSCMAPVAVFLHSKLAKLSPQSASLTKRKRR